MPGSRLWIVRAAVVIAAVMPAAVATPSAGATDGRGALDRRSEPPTEPRSQYCTWDEDWAAASGTTDCLDLAKACKYGTFMADPSASPKEGWFTCLAAPPPSGDGSDPDNCC